jgi:rubrerythrin
MAEEGREQARAFIRARPIRVAYLVENNEHSHAILDGIFAAALSHWGGRYSLICPCEDGAPRASYLPWLKAYDPDVIYAFNNLNEDALRRIRESLGPAYLIHHYSNERSEIDAQSFRVELPINPLRSLSTVLQYAQAFPPSAPQPIKLVDYLPGQPNDRFVDDNFGAFYRSYGRWPVPENLADSVLPLTVASEELLKATYRGRRHDGETVPDTPALLRFMATNRNTFGLAQIAADAAPRIETRENFDEAFTLFIGDSYADRIAFWNLRSRDPAFLGREMTTLIVSPARLDDSVFFEALVEFLKNRNGVPRNSGTPWVRLVSESVDADRLHHLLERFRAADRWNGFNVSTPLTLDSIVPSARALERATLLVSGGVFERIPEAKEFPASGEPIRPPNIVPRHLAHVQSRSLATMGSWALDITIERKENLSRYTNVRHTWHFPRRLRFHKAFREDYESTHEGREYRHARANAAGGLTLFAGFGEEVPPITIPTDEEAFRFAMQRGDTWPPVTRFGEWPAPSGPFAWARPSDKGRYLIGALRLFGGLQDGAAVLLHPFWRSAFAELGGATGGANLERIKDSVKKKTRLVTSAPRDWDEDAWDRLTALIASEARQVRIPQRSLTFEELRERHAPYLAREEEALRGRPVEEREEWMAHALRSLRNGIQNRCARRIMFQGYQWRCDTCFNSNWNDISALQAELTCPVCGASEAAPVDKPWSFALNGFLRDALREHGLLASCGVLSP